MKKLLILIILAMFLIPVASAQIVPRDFIVEVEKGNIPGHHIITIRGHSHSIGASEQIIWGIAANYVFPTVATTMNVSSTDIDDAVGGTGLWNLTVYGLTFAGVEINETIQMNGQNPVGTVNKYFRINRLIGLEGGASRGNEGTVYIGVGAPAAGVPSIATYNMIEETRGNSLCGVYSLPVNHTAFLISGRCGTSDNKLVSFSLTTRSMAKDNQVWRYFRHLQVDQQYVYFDAIAELVCQRADILLKAEAASADTRTTFNYKLLVIDNDLLHNSTLDWSDGTPSEVVISTPLDVNIVGSIELMSTQFFAFIVLASVTMYIAWNTDENQKAALGYAFSTLFWIATMYQWAVDQAGTQSFNLMWLYIAPLSFCIVQFLNKNWFSYDDVEEKMRKRSRP